MTQQRTVAVVGGGPAGIMAALEAAARLGAADPSTDLAAVCCRRAGPGAAAVPCAAAVRCAVTLFDTNPLVGRRLLVTGNGRCNISHTPAEPERYACADPAALAEILSRYSQPRTIERLRGLAIPTYATPDGWCYPLSESAATVAEALAAALELAGVRVRLQTHVVDLRPQRPRWAVAVAGPRNWEEFDALVVATGGRAQPALGAKGDLWPALERLGHTILPARPALAPLLAEVKRFHKLQGVRLDVGLTLYDGPRRLGAAAGNLMFTQTGFSGPAAMDISHLVSARPGAALTLRIDLLDGRRAALEEVLAAHRRTALPLAVALGAVLPAKMPPVLLPMAGLPAGARLAEVNDAALARLLDLLGGLEVAVRGTRGFDVCQLSTGGVPLSEVHPRTMASRLAPGLYLAGELLDVAGPCGGYNLQFAWSSGALAGMAAAGSEPGMDDRDDECDE